MLKKLLFSLAVLFCLGTLANAQITPPDGNLGAFVPFNTCSTNWSGDNAPVTLTCSATNPGSATIQSQQGTFIYHQTNANAVFSGVTLPYYINPSYITKIYAISNATFSGTAGYSLGCSWTGGSASPSLTPQSTQVNTLLGNIGSVYSSITCTLNLVQSTYGSYGTVALSTMGLWIEYTNPPPTPPTASMIGTIQYHNGTLFNGTLKVSFGKASVLDICTNPVQVVRNAQVSVPVVNGIPDSSYQFIRSDCIGNLPYYVQIFDTKNNNVQNINWYVMPDSSGDLDVGDMILSNFGGPIVVAVPQPIVSTPSGAQTVTQPGTTFLSVNNLAVTNQLIYSGTIASSISGNAATATELATAPSQCAANYFSTGIAQNGNANCSNSWPAATSTFATATITGGTNSYSSAAGYFNYNMNSNGRLDSIVNPGSGSGGWAWYKSSNTTTPVAHLDLSGNLTANSFIGALVGNASTATSLGTTPSQCPSGQLATGIAANGNANCTSSGSGSRTCNSNGCYIVRPDGTIIEWGQVTTDINGGTVAVTFPYTFPSSCSMVIANASGANDRVTYVVTSGASAAPCTTSGFTVGNNGSGDGATWFAVGW